MARRCDVNSASIRVARAAPRACPSIAWPVSVAAGTRRNDRKTAVRDTRRTYGHGAILIGSIPRNVRCSVLSLGLRVHVSVIILRSERRYHPRGLCELEIARSYAIATSVMVGFEDVDAHPGISGITRRFEIADLSVLRVTGEPHGERRRIRTDDFHGRGTVIDRCWFRHRLHYVQ